MFEKILYPTDFSNVSQKALDYVKQLKQAGGREVIVLHVIDERELESIRHHALGRDDVFEKLHESMSQNAKEATAAMAENLKASGFRVKIRIETGVPVPTILRVEEEEKASVVVIGSHGRSMIEEMFLGSVSEKVVRRSSRPVIVVR